MGTHGGPFSDPLGHGLPIFIVQVVLILVIVRILGKALSLVRQPMVIGEICAGILLGPSALGRIGLGDPNGFSARVFPPSDMPVLQIFAQIGLVFFMFFLGLEVDITLMTKQWRFALPTAVASIVGCFGCGYALAGWMWKIDPPPQGESQRLGFNLFVGTSLSFTAFPVLARILVSMKLVHSPVGIPVLGIAAIDDVLAWCVLAFVLSVSSGGPLTDGVIVVVCTVGFMAFLAVPVHRFLTMVNKYYIYKGDEMNLNFIALLFVLLCAASWFAEVLGIHAFFGAFAFGAIVPKGDKLVHELAPRIELMITEFFLPLYFANSGLRTDVTTMTSGDVWACLFVTILVASAGKMLPVLVITRLSGRSWRRSISVSLMMNTRGLVTLIVLNIGMDLGLLTPKVFTIMVIMSLVTTFMTSPLLYYVYGKLWARKMAQALALQEQEEEAEIQKGLEHGTAEAEDSESDANADAWLGPRGASARRTRSVPALGLRPKSHSPRSPVSRVDSIGVRSGASFSPRQHSYGTLAGGVGRRPATVSTYAAPFFRRSRILPSHPNLDEVLLEPTNDRHLPHIAFHNADFRAYDEDDEFGAT